MKNKILFILLSLCFVICIIPLNSVSAANKWDITYSLTSNGKHIDYAKTGDEVTVIFALGRTDLPNSWYMPNVYQAEIMYDESFFEYVPNSTTVIKDYTGIQKLKREPGAHIIQITEMFPEFKGEMQLGSFKLKVIGTSGSGKIYSDLDPERSFLCDTNGNIIIPEFNNLEIIIDDGDGFDVKVFDYVSGYRLVEVDGNAAGYSFDDNEMLLSKNYGGKRVWITDGLQNYTLEEAAEKAKELVKQSSVTSIEVTDVGSNVNSISVSDGKVDFKDASAVNAVKNVWTSVNEENIIWFLNADVNADYTVNENDVLDVLDAYSPN